MTTRSRGLKIRRAATALLVAALAGCSDVDDPGTEPSPSTTSPSTTSATDPDSSPTAGTSPTESATPEVEPASGRRIGTKRFTFNAPQEWAVNSDQLPFVQLIRDPGNKIRLAEPHGLISVNVLPSGRSFTLDQEARRSGGGGRRLDDADLDGEQVYHFSRSSRIESTETYGLWREPFESISITFRLFGTSRTEREAMVESVLASWEWRQ